MEHAWVLAVLTDIRKYAEKNRLLELHDAVEPALNAAAQLSCAKDVTQFLNRVGRPTPAKRDMLSLMKKAKQSHRL